MGESFKKNLRRLGAGAALLGAVAIGKNQLETPDGPQVDPQHDVAAQKRIRRMETIETQGFDPDAVFQSLKKLNPTADHIFLDFSRPPDPVLGSIGNEIDRPENEAIAKRYRELLSEVKIEVTDDEINVFLPGELPAANDFNILLRVSNQTPISGLREGQYTQGVWDVYGGSKGSVITKAEEEGGTLTNAQSWAAVQDRLQQGLWDCAMQQVGSSERNP